MNVQDSDQELNEYKAKHPDFFPPGTPVEEQKAFLKNLQTLHLQQEADKHAIFAKLDTLVEDNNKLNEARVLYEEGKFIDYCLAAFGKIWKNDSYIMKAMMYIAASFKLKNPDEGIHIHVTGSTQIGKSDSVNTALKFIRAADKVVRTFSPKWIFYAGNLLHENVILFSDDTVLDPNIAALYRNILTSWHEGVVRGSVFNNKAVDLTVPRHVSLILTSIDDVVEESNEGQDESRFLTLEVRRTKEQLQEIMDFIQGCKTDVSKEIETVHTVWDIIPYQDVIIHKQIVKDCTIREFKRFMTLVKCNALLHNRTTTTDADFEEVEQFLTYSKPMIDSQTPALKRDERLVLSVLSSEWKSTDKIQDETRLTPQRVYRALHGKKGTFDRPDGGLMNSIKTIKRDFNPDTRVNSFRIA